MALRPFSTAILLLPLFVLAVSAQDELPPQGKKGKVCVAIVANSTTNSIFVERLTDRLVQSLTKDEIDAVGMKSSSPVNGKLEPSVENGKESKDQDCLYILLTRFIDQAQHPTEITGPRISFGQRPNTVDAADPSNTPMALSTLRIDFALFRNGRFKPVTDAAVLGHRPDGASDNFQAEMDQEANRVTHDINKK